MFAPNAVPTTLQVAYSWMPSITSHSCVKGVALGQQKYVAPSVCVCVYVCDRAGQS